jgi:YesN/AraC family two-component response regulator
MNQAREQQRSHQGNSGSKEAISMKRKSLLIVDDELIILNSLSRELVSADLEVTTAASGEDAVAKINNGFFDLVMTDLMMPGIDGFQVLKAAKQRDLQIMVIILTGYGVMESAIDALRLGADDFLQKPCDTDELLYRISNCFVKQELLRKIAIYENFLPVCCYCKKIRDDQQGEYGKGKWYSLEDYFSKTKGVDVSHGICPDCYTELMKDRSSW